MGEVLAQAIILLFIMIFGGMVAAVFLRAVAQWVEQIDVPYEDAYGIVLLSGMAGGFVGLCGGLGVSSATGSRDAVYAVALFLTPVGFLTQAETIRIRIGIPFRRACLVTAVMLVTGLVTAVIIALLVAGMLWLAR